MRILWTIAFIVILAICIVNMNFNGFTLSNIFGMFIFLIIVFFLGVGPPLLCKSNKQLFNSSKKEK